MISTGSGGFQQFAIFPADVNYRGINLKNAGEVKIGMIDSSRI